MAKALTARSVEQAKAEAARREVPDGLLTGLYLVVQPSGAKSWAVRYRHAGKPRKLTLGAYPALGLGEAREAAKSQLRAAAEGIDPASEKVMAKRQAKAAVDENRDLMANICADFIKRYAKPKNRSWGETDRLFAREVLPAWSERRVQEIGRRDVIELLDRIVDRGAGVTANRVLAAIRRLFNWCVERGVITVSPCTGVKAPTPEKSRDRILSDDELRLLWRATETISYPFGPLTRFLLLTAQRREEVASLTRDELDMQTRMWTLPRARAKNDREHVVPLSDGAIAILEALPRISGSAGYVFTGTGRTPVSGFSRAKVTLDAKMLELAQADAAERGDDPSSISLPHWTMHDLRRTAASGMARLGVPVHIIEAVLNHRSGTLKGVAATYNRYAYTDEKRRALEAWGRLVADLVDGTPAGNVVPLLWVM